MSGKAYESLNFHSKTYGSFEFCPFCLEFSAENSGPISRLESEFDKELSPEQVSGGISKEISKNIIPHVAGKLWSEQYYIYSVSSRNFIFFDEKSGLTEDKMHQIVSDIDEFKVTPKSNKLFADKLWLAKFEKDFKNT